VSSRLPGKRLENPVFPVMIMDMSMPQDIESALNALASKLGESGTKIADLTRLSGGASQETWRFSIIDPDGTETRRILRRAPNGLSDARSSTALPLSSEARLIEVAGAAGVPVPSIVHVLTELESLGDGFIMDFLDGETIGPKILRSEALSSARNRLAAQCGDALAHTHSIDGGCLPRLETASASEQLDRYEDLYRNYDIPRPTFELAFQMLRDTTPAPLEPVLVHGDFRLGNLMVNEAGLAGVLDWELAHMGDPREDIGWICVNSWRFGKTENRVGGFGRLEDLLEAYAAAGGQRFSPDEIDWWEMLGSLKWGIMCMTMYDIYRTGADPSVERAAIGRRVSETEIDLIALMEARLTNA
ncbi:MAG: phosphotransferase family protein, partial [Pseudomonadota bacterium]